MAAKFSIIKDRKGQYRFNLKASNGEIIATSESYPEKKSALKGIASIQKNAATAKISDDTGEVEVPKTRGRKPAAKETTTAKTAPKPRGRPAAAKKSTTAKDAPQKRGRKPKAL